MFLKLYDRRFCPQMRKNEVTPAWNNEREREYFEFVSSDTGTTFLESLEQNKNGVDPTTVAQEESYLYKECENH